MDLNENLTLDKLDVQKISPDHGHARTQMFFE